MNTKLVESLVQIIESITPEEQTILEEKLQAKKQKPTWQENQQKLRELQKKVFERRGGKPLEPSPEEIIHQIREERTEQIMMASFPDLDPSSYKEEKY
jgi:hypothetical protein